MFTVFSLGVWKSSKKKIGTQLVEQPWEHSQTLLTSTFPAETVDCVAQPTGNVVEMALCFPMDRAQRPCCCFSFS